MLAEKRRKKKQVHNHEALNIFFYAAALNFTLCVKKKNEGDDACQRPFFFSVLHTSCFIVR
jgi:hypothetical protein